MPCNPFDARNLEPCFPQPLLNHARPQTAAKTIEQGAGIGCQVAAPDFQSLPPDLTGNQFMTECDGPVPAGLFEACADGPPLLVIQQRQVGGSGKSAAFKFNRSPQVQQGCVADKQFGERRWGNGVWHGAGAVTA